MVKDFMKLDAKNIKFDLFEKFKSNLNQTYLIDGPVYGPSAVNEVKVHITRSEVIQGKGQR